MVENRNFSEDKLKFLIQSQEPKSNNNLKTDSSNKGLETMRTEYIETDNNDQVSLFQVDKQLKFKKIDSRQAYGTKNNITNGNGSGNPLGTENMINKPNSQQQSQKYKINSTDMSKSLLDK